MTDTGYEIWIKAIDAACKNCCDPRKSVCSYHEAWGDGFRVALELFIIANV